MATKDVDLKDMVAIVYGGWMQHEGQNVQSIPLAYGMPLYMSDEKNGADSKLSANMASVMRIVEGDENEALAYDRTTR